MKQFYNQKGFTLVEMIISVALIAVLGVYLVQMFLFASMTNERAKIVDLAMAQCINVMDRISAEASPQQAIAQAEQDGAYTEKKADGSYVITYELDPDANKLASRDAGKYRLEIAYERVDQAEQTAIAFPSGTDRIMAERWSMDIRVYAADNPKDIVTTLYGEKYYCFAGGTK